MPNDGARDIPDVSLFAGNGMNGSFYVICQMDANALYGGSSGSCDLNAPYMDFQGGSGTSASAQVFAGVMALVNQAHGRQGNANYVLYPMAAKSGASCNSSTAPVTNSSCIFYDVTVGNNSVICQGGSPNCSNTNTASGQYGIMVSGGSPAYATTPGYDLATGLGSVNVANLVNNWTSNFTPSTTTLSLSTSPATNPITLTHGQPINFTVNVTSGSGTPAGDVSLIAQTGSSASKVTGIGPFTLSGGIASGSTLMLPGGSYNVTAHYAGNGTFAASDSSPGIPVTVGKESSLTEAGAVSCNYTSVSCTYGVTNFVYGSSFTMLRMDVTNSGGQLCAPTNSSGEQLSMAYPCPTGAVTVTPAPTDVNSPTGTVPGSYTLNSQGYAEDQFIQQTPGVYGFVASYAGDNSYTASTSPTLPITIVKALTTLTGCTLPSTVQLGTPVNCTVTVNTQSYGVAPTGTVQFLLGSSVVSAGGDVVMTNGSSTSYASTRQDLSPIFNQGGTFSVIQQYPGDSYYLSSMTSPAVTLNVSDFNVSFNPSTITIPVPGQSGTTTVTLAPVAGFMGTVTLGCGSPGPSIGCSISPPSVTLTGASSATATLTVTTAAATSATPPALRRNAPPSIGLSPAWFWLLTGLLALAMLATLAIGRRSASWLCATALLVMGAWVACGGGGGGANNPPANSTPAVDLSPSTLSFGQQNLGTVSAPHSVTLTNTGTAVLAITGVYLLPAGDTEFNAWNGCDSTPKLAPGGNCSIQVTFAPTVAGSYSASVSITDNAPGSPQTATLTGVGALSPTSPGTYSIQVQAVSGNDYHYPNVSVSVQ